MSLLRLMAAAASVAAITACGSSGTDSAASPAATPDTSISCASISGLTGSVDDHGSRRSSGASLDLEADDSYFEPTCATGVPAGALTVSIKNSGKALHNISVIDQNIDTDLPPGATVTVRITVASSPVRYFCKYHRASGMQGAVVPAGA